MKHSECCESDVIVHVKKSIIRGIEWESFTCQKCGQPCDVIEGDDGQEATDDAEK